MRSIGPQDRIAAVAGEHRIDISACEIVDVAHSHDAAAKGVALIRQGRGELLMKGSLHTDELLHDVTSRETGLRTARRISHVFIMDVPTYPEPLFITGAAVNIFPDLEAKHDIVQGFRRPPDVPSVATGRGAHVQGESLKATWPDFGRVSDPRSAYRLRTARSGLP